MLSSLDLISSRIQFLILTDEVTVLDFVFSGPQHNECWQCAQGLYGSGPDVLQKLVMLCHLNLLILSLFIYLNCKTGAHQHIKLLSA